jgi:hypothetical protein
MLLYLAGKIIWPRLSRRDVIGPPITVVGRSVAMVVTKSCG